MDAQHESPPAWKLTEVHVKLEEAAPGASGRLRGFCSVTFDDTFVVRDLKIIEGGGGLFVAMPSRKIVDKCPACGGNNHLRARFCNACGGRLDEDRVASPGGPRVKLYADVAHPITHGCREAITSAVLVAYAREVELSKQEGYVPRYREFDGGDDVFPEAASQAPPLRRHLAAPRTPSNGGVL